MRKLAITLLAASGVALAAPAHAQGFWFGIGPFGFGIGAAPYAYSYEPYWGGPYAYEAPLTTEYVAPAYTYAAPAYETSYAYVPDYTYAYEPTYTSRTTYRYTSPRYAYLSYAYQPAYSYRRSVRRVYEPTWNRALSYAQASRTRRISYHTRRHIARVVPTSEAYRAQASVPMTPMANTQKTNTRSPYCNLAKQERNPVSWNAYYHCLSR
jgi:hypothetical protein